MLEIGNLREEDIPDNLKIINEVINEFHTLTKYLRLEKNTIFNVTELIREAYSADINKFKVVTSQISFIITKIFSNFPYIGSKPSQYRLTEYELIIFADNKVDNLEKINIGETVELLDIDLMSFKNLSKCTFHFNRLYLENQFNMIPGILHRVYVKEKVE